MGGGSFEITTGMRQLSMADHLLNSNFSVRSLLRFILFWLVLFLGYVLLHFSRTLMRATSSQAQISGGAGKVRASCGHSCGHCSGERPLLQFVIALVVVAKRPPKDGAVVWSRRRVD